MPSHAPARLRPAPRSGARPFAALLGLALLIPATGSLAADFGLNLGLNVPLGDFSDDHNATFGFGGVIEGNGELSSNAHWNTSIGLLLNPLDEPSGMPSNVDLGSWINIPILTGPRILAGNSQATGYAQAQVGMNLGSQTESSDPSTTVNVDWAPSLAFGAGAGILVQAFHIGFRFYYLGEPEHKFTLSQLGFSESVEGDVSKSVLHLFVGLNFRHH